MSCLCHKLRTRNYGIVTQIEADLLKQTWTEASHLFGDSPPAPAPLAAPSRPKRPSPNRQPSRPPKTSRTALNNPGPVSHPPSPAETEGRLVVAATPPAVRDLVGTYSYQGAARAVGSIGKLDHQTGGDIGGVFARIFLAIERIDRKVEIHQLFRRIYCYAFAQLHKKGTSVDPIVREIQDALPLAQDTRPKVYYILRLGAKWTAIVHEFGSITRHPPQELTGLLCLLGAASSWERVPVEDYRSALTILSAETDICDRVLQFTPLVKKTLDEILLRHSFVDETRRLVSLAKPASNAVPFPPGRSRLVVARPVQQRSLHTMPKAGPAWKAASLTAVANAAPGSDNAWSEDAAVLMALLCFFAAEKLPMDMLLRGAGARRRWTGEGGIEAVEARHVGLAPELADLISNPQRLGDAFAELGHSSSASTNTDGSQSVDGSLAAGIRDSIPPDLVSFWRRQALIIAWRAIPWKYLELPVSTTNLFLPHLQHALKACRDELHTLPAESRADLALSLLEASRFPGMAWKRFAVGQADVAARGISDRYLRYGISQSQCLLSRITGDMDRATLVLRNLQEDVGSNSLGSREMDSRLHAASGQVILQQALNCVQVEEISAARGLLEGWKQLGQGPSQIEQVVLFRRNLMLGRLLRFQGAFSESLARLEEAQQQASRVPNGLVYDEDLRDLACELADTLRELDDPASAEGHLRAELERRGRNSASLPSSSPLDLCLAEALFAQSRLDEAESLCLEVQSRPNLLKLERLRSHITLAKIRHVRCANEEALACWGEAMKAIGRFRLTNGRTTRIIIVSICDTLSGLGHASLVNESLKQVAALDELARPGGIQHWIAGLRHWLEYLESQGRLGSM